MGGKRNKIRYQATPKLRPELELSGNVYLQYRDDEEIENAKRGDMMLFPSIEALHTIHQGDYDTKGYAGYFKVDVCDGREWQPLILQEVFTLSENHFAKREHPIDVAEICRDILRGLKGKMLERTYREHYKIINPAIENTDKDINNS